MNGQQRGHGREGRANQHGAAVPAARPDHGECHGGTGRESCAHGDRQEGTSAAISTSRGPKKWTSATGPIAQPARTGSAETTRSRSRECIVLVSNNQRCGHESRWRGLVLMSSGWRSSLQQLLQDRLADTLQSGCRSAASTSSRCPPVTSSRPASSTARCSACRARRGGDACPLQSSRRHPDHRRHAVRRVRP